VECAHLGPELGIARGRDDGAQFAGVGVEPGGGERPDAALGQHHVGVGLVFGEEPFERERLDLHTPASSSGGKNGSAV
jgi:hypothetical protein